MSWESAEYVVKCFEEKYIGLEGRERCNKRSA